MENQIDVTYQLVDKFLNEAPREEVEALFKKIDDMDIQGPTVDEYMSALQSGLEMADEEMNEIDLA